MKNTVKGVVPSTNVIAVGSSSSVDVKEEHKAVSDDLRKAARVAHDSDFVASVTYIRPGTSKRPEVDEQEQTHLTKKIVQDIKSMSLNDALKNKVNSSRGGLRRSERKVDKCVEKRDERIGQKTYIAVEVKSTECKHMRVEHMRSATLGWSFDSLKKRESSELDADGLGSATFKPLSRTTPMAIDTSTGELGSAT
ncbi:hypothetical protein L6452_34217 [Arctium lappa]|uniref:Uncharacterized protein n=1 Tax=Arctium lappa TaxID=4217 RepID=A0ACB8YIA0_ARCLA|nr:hypothetical protein L6452_34217 [Arctium lappa]